MNYNKVMLGGNLTRDPETRFLSNGDAIVKFGLAVNRSWKGGDGSKREEVTFVDVVMFGKRAEAFARFHSKGNAAFIEGRLKLDQWDDKTTGQKRSKLHVVAEAWEFVGGGKSPSDAPQADAATSDPVDETPF